MATMKLELNADTVEFCPFEGFQDFLAAGCYQLDVNSQQRHGKLYLFSLSEDDNDSGVLTEWSCIDTEGIFDMDWISINKKIFITTASADGAINLFSVSEEKCLVKQVTCRDLIKQGMMLSVDTGKYSAVDTDRICGSSSSGELFSTKVESIEVSCELKWQGHELETWCITRDYWMSDIVYSGADDCKLKAWDMRNGIDPVFALTKEHKAGVCCISSSHLRQFLILTGSYDEYVRVWDVRNISKPICKSKACCGGGVWRLKWHPFDPNRILAACMHNGFSLWRLDETGSLDLKLDMEYKKHQSLAYGADWSWQTCSIEDTYIATCSFYDNLLNIWKFDNPVE